MTIIIERGLTNCCLFRRHRTVWLFSGDLIACVCCTLSKRACKDKRPSWTIRTIASAGGNAKGKQNAWHVNSRTWCNLPSCHPSSLCSVDESCRRHIFAPSGPDPGKHKPVIVNMFGEWHSGGSTWQDGFRRVTLPCALRWSLPYPADWAADICRSAPDDYWTWNVPQIFFQFHWPLKLFEDWNLIRR